jgi:hypothetical protein
MCFVLYAGTTKPLPLRKWEHGSPDLPVEALTEREALVRRHFNTAEVQFIGSSSGCGCDFPHVMFQGGDWPYSEDPDFDPEQGVVERLNCQRLVGLLEKTGDSSVELYGAWDGGGGGLLAAPQAQDTIPFGSDSRAWLSFQRAGILHGSDFFSMSTASTDVRLPGLAQSWE